MKSGKSISKVSKELGIIPTMLSRWIYEYRELGEKAFSGNGNKIQNKDYEIEKLKKVEFPKKVYTELRYEIFSSYSTGLK